MTTPKALVILAAFVASTLSAPASAVDWGAPPVVTVSCSGCHGIDGNSQSPIMPRLAGQSADYLQAQLSAYQLAQTPQVDWLPFISLEEKPGARTGPQARRYMVGPAHSSDAEATKAAADWYAKQKPAPGRPAGAPELVARGAKVYAEGLPDENVAACITCHGPGGQGRGQYPRLAGQHSEYITSQIELLATGKRPSAVMGPTAHALSKGDIEALAAYLQQL
jgi:cytochrome c553